VKIAVHAKIEEFVIPNPDGDVRIGVREAREAENESRYEMFKEREQVVREGAREIIYRQTLNLFTLRKRELYLALAYVNGIVGEDGKEIFKSGTDRRGNRRVSAAMTEVEFNETLGLIDSDVVDEMINFVRKVNPTWGEYVEKEEETAEQAEAPTETEIQDAAAE
jgi:hypothetical protein